MLTTITVLTCLIFSALYPLCFWLVKGHPIDASFRRFNLGMANFAGGLSLGILLSMNVPENLKILACLWQGLTFLTSFLLWNKTDVNRWLLTLSSLFGVAAYAQFQNALLPSQPASIAVTTLGGLVLCISLFAMILGHWYLNVHGLPIEYFLKTTYAFWVIVSLRGIWDVCALFTQKIVHGGDSIFLYQFLRRIDGILLFVPIFFGTLLPIILLYFVKETLKVKSTQSATGLLYCIVIAVLMGDLGYKYFLFKFGLVL